MPSAEPLTPRATETSAFVGGSRYSLVDDFAGASDFAAVVEEAGVVDAGVLEDSDDVLEVVLEDAAGADDPLALDDPLDDDSESPLLFAGLP